MPWCVDRSRTVHDRAVRHTARSATDVTVALGREREARSRSSEREEKDGTEVVRGEGDEAEGK
eukprot:8303119-Pyramimonas_sp.AAC.1